MASAYQTSCRSCGRTFPQGVRLLRCPCGGLIDFSFGVPADPSGDPKGRGIWRYAPWLPVDPRFAVSLHEGNTPLHPARVLAGVELWLKDETRNPTGSVKDRALAVAVAKAREWGVDRVALFSMGSTGLAAAAFTARAGLGLTVFVLEGVLPEVAFPLWQLGARVVAVRGDADSAIEALQEACRHHDLVELTTCRSANPYQSEAPKTIAYEIVQQGLVPDWVVVPVGGGGTLAGIAKGFRELEDAGRILRRPRLLGVQIQGFHLLRLALDRGCSGEDELRALAAEVPGARTVAAKLAHRFPYDASEALQAIRTSGGDVEVVDDAACLTWARRLAATEGLFAEASSATVLAALAQRQERGELAPGSRVVAVVTGSGFREVATWVRWAPVPEFPVIEPEPAALARRRSREGWEGADEGGSPVQLDGHVYLVGSGALGFDLTDDFDCHVYLVRSGDELALVDIGAGMGVPAILANVRSHGFSTDQIRYLLLTHPHGDHCGGAAALVEAVPGVTVVAHPRAADCIRSGDEAGMALDRAREAGLYPPDYRLEPCRVDREVTEGDRLPLGSSELLVFETPGHAGASVSFWAQFSGRRYLFSGDLVFHGGRILLQPTHHCSIQDYVRSLNKLTELEVDVLLPGHGAFSLRNGRRHIAAAAEHLRRLALPPQAL